MLAKRNGTEIRKVNPAYTSIIGKLKYAPQYNIDKDVAAAFVIARRGLGYKESLPKNYKKLLNDTEFLSYSVAKIEDNVKMIKKNIKEERNEYKRNRLKSNLVKLRKNLEVLQKHLESGKSESASQQPVNQWKEQLRGLPKGRHKNWQVLFIAFTFSCLESYRDFSPLKRILLNGDWVRMVSRLVPILGIGTMMLPKYRRLGLGSI